MEDIINNNVQDNIENKDITYYFIDDNHFDRTLTSEQEVVTYHNEHGIMSLLL